MKGSRMGRQRVDLQEAAEILGISSDAVRKRAKRGTLAHETGSDGKLYVWVDNGDPDRRTPPHDDRDELVEFLRAELAAWQEEARRKDHIIAALTERIPAIEAPASPETRESPETASAPAEGGEAPSEERRPWWRRWF